MVLALDCTGATTVAICLFTRSVAWMANRIDGCLFVLVFVCVFVRLLLSMRVFYWQTATSSHRRRRRRGQL